MAVRCPRCDSPRVQRGYKDAPKLFRLAGRHELLCNNCGLEFRGFDFSGELKRKASAGKETSASRRRATRHRAHLPASVSVIRPDPRTGRPSYSEPARGSCISISEIGLAVSFRGARIESDDLIGPGRTLMISVTLPDGPVDVFVKVVRCDRHAEAGGGANWVLGASIVRLSEGDKPRFDGYLEARASEDRTVVMSNGDEGEA